MRIICGVISVAAMDPAKKKKLGKAALGAVGLGAAALIGHKKGVQKGKVKGFGEGMKSGMDIGNTLQGM